MRTRRNRQPHRQYEPGRPLRAVLGKCRRYLNAIDPDGYEPAIRTLVAGAIDKDREHKYLPDLLQGLYGEDYEVRAKELIAADDNFRRIYKRLFPTTVI